MLGREGERELKAIGGLENIDAIRNARTFFLCEQADGAKKFCEIILERNGRFS